jgi:hypothetical protein
VPVELVLSSLPLSDLTAELAAAIGVVTVVMVGWLVAGGVIGGSGDGSGGVGCWGAASVVVESVDMAGRVVAAMGASAALNSGINEKIHSLYECTRV